MKVNEDPEVRKLIPESVAIEEMKPLQDYIIHEMIREAEKRRLPVQIHTGLHEGNENIIDNSNPVHLVNLFMEYRGAKFDIFHGGWPYCGELGALAKNFPNVYIDMCWMHIISPSRSRSALSDLLDEVPANKIMGFGGDYLFVEGVYGHAVIAKENIARVFAEKVDEGSYTMDEAKKYIELLAEHVGLFKVGLELFIRSGPEIIKFIHSTSTARVFLDLKLHDIPATVCRAMARIADLGVAFATVHVGEKKQMLEAAVQGSRGKAGVLGVTVLTSVSGQDLKSAGYRKDIYDDMQRTVIKRAQLAFETGCVGVICSGLEAKGIKAQFGKDFLAVTPGIRPAHTRPPH